MRFLTRISLHKSLCTVNKNRNRIGANKSGCLQDRAQESLQEKNPWLRAIGLMPAYKTDGQVYRVARGRIPQRTRQCFQECRLYTNA
jgi:hypothetical protein